MAAKPIPFVQQNLTGPHPANAWHAGNQDNMASVKPKVPHQCVSNVSGRGLEQISENKLAACIRQSTFPPQSVEIFASLDVGKWCSIKGKTSWGSSLSHSTVGYYDSGRGYSIYIISGLSREFNQLVYVLVSGKMVSIILCSCFIFTTIPSQYYILWLFVTVQILNIAVLLT